MIQELNDHGFTDTGTPRKVSMLNDALYSAASRESWPFLERVVDLTFDGSSGIPTNLPNTFLRTVTAVNTDSKRKVEWERTDVLEGQGLDWTQTGEAQYFYQYGPNGLAFWPLPPADQTVRLRYIKRPAPLTDSTVEADIEWPIQHHRAIVLGALYRLYDLEDDPELAVRFQQHYEQRIIEMIGDVFTRQTDRPERIHTDPWFDGDIYD